jgi:hypothetical protein
VGNDVVVGSIYTKIDVLLSIIKGKSSNLVFFLVYAISSSLSEWLNVYDVFEGLPRNNSSL